jgi:hypothetical protein
MAESDLLQPVKDLLDERRKESKQLLASLENKKKLDPGGFLSNRLAATAQGKALGSLKNNPIINMGKDTINQTIAGMSQSLVGGLNREISKAISPIQSTVNGFFSALASVTTFGVEIGLEIARNGGRSILKALDEKDKILTDLQTETTALFNACAILANSQPFLNAYIAKLLEAYELLLTSRNEFNTVSKVLVSRKQYRARTFNSALSNLVAAKDLILPDKNAVLSIRDTGDFISNTVKRASNKEALAAALSIPGITFKIGKLLISYSAKTVEINNLITNFMGALNDFIAAYKRNDSLDKAVSRHIDSGVFELDKLLNEMELLLFPTDSVQSAADYGLRVTTSASFWGLKVNTVEEWMKLAPTKALEQLESTGESIRRYNVAVASLKAINNIAYRGGVNEVDQGRENGFRTLDVYTKTIVKANTLVARKISIDDVRADFFIAKQHADSMIAVSAAIRDAITPFVRTPSSAVGPAKKLVGSIVAEANKLGLDRISRLVNIGAVGQLFSANASTATFAGNLVTGLNITIKKASASPNTNQQSLQRVVEVRDQVERDRVTKSLEANRANKATPEKTAEREKEKLKKFEDEVRVAEEASKQIDASTAAAPDLNRKTEQRVNKLVPGFSGNSYAQG